MSQYEEIETGALIKVWIQGVPLGDGARRQLANVARLPFIRLYRGDAGYPLGMRRDRWQRDSDRGRNHPGGCWH